MEDDSRVEVVLRDKVHLKTTIELLCLIKPDTDVENGLGSCEGVGISFKAHRPFPDCFSRQT